MTKLLSRYVRVGLTLLFVLALVSSSAFALQATLPLSPRLRGTVKDPSGAAMSGVDVAVMQAGKVLKAAKTDDVGIFSFDLTSGDYELAVTAPDFKVHRQPVRVSLNMPSLIVTLNLEGITTNVEVISNSNRVTVDAGLSLDATTITADQLSGLPEDEESLLAFLQALAGGEGNAQLMIDGFEGGRMPTRDQIAAIVIEPNSFNAAGTGPRITITTRQPGPTRWDGSATFQFRDSALNARTPHAENKPQNRRSVINTSYRGPVIKGKLGMTFNLSKQQSESGNTPIRAITANGPIDMAVFSPYTYDSLGVIQQWYLRNNHSLSIDLRYTRSKSLNQGIGGFTLAERASDSSDNGWTIQLSDNKTISPRMTNTFNFRYNRSNSQTTPRTNAVAINVIDAFSGGGAQNRNETRYGNFNLNDTLRWTPTPKWNLQFYLNVNRTSNYVFSENNYLGTFTFSSLEEYLAGRPIQFTQTSGNPVAQVAQTDANISLQATYRITPTMSYSAGAQYQVQTHLKDYNNVSPTMQFQMQVKRRSTISIGARLTHNTVGIGNYEQLIRGDGTTRQFNTVISNPLYPDPFAEGESGTTTGAGTVRQMRHSTFVAPSTFNTQISLNQTLPKNWRFTASFNVTRGMHQIRNRNINAPYPGTPLSPTLTREEIDQLRPFYPFVGRILQFESTGSAIQKNLNFQVQVPSTNKFLRTQFSGIFQYTLGLAHDDGGYQNPYNIRADWARSNSDQRHRLTSTFQIRPPKVGQFSFNVVAQSGRVYSITTGRDDNFDQSNSDRPEGVPRNSLRAPGSYVVNLTYNTPAFSLRKKKAPAGETASGAAGVPGVSAQDALLQSALNAGLPPQAIQQLLSSITAQPGIVATGPVAPVAQPTLANPQFTFNVSVQNLLNNTRINGYSGVLTSPLFGRPTSYMAGRTIMLSLNSRF